MTGTFSLNIHGLAIAFDCPDAEASAVIVENFGAMASSGGRSCTLFHIRRMQGREGFAIERAGQAPLIAANTSDLIYELEGAITVDLQLLRRDLLFIHAAVLERNGRAILLVADSGGGKSTTAWALLHHGFSYLSDELAAIATESGMVYGYPHAVCLKREPPGPYALPKGALRLGRTLHVPVRQLPAKAGWGPLPLGAVFFVNFVAEHAEPSLEPIGVGAASARIYANVLNALAHPGAGLDSAIGLARALPCRVLNSGDLAGTCALVAQAVDAL